MDFLLAVELGLLAAQPALGFRHLHALAGAEPDEVRLELGHHGENVEQQPTDDVGRVADRATEREADLPCGEFVGDRPCVGQGPGQSLELGDHEGVTGTAGRECLA